MKKILILFFTFHCLSTIQSQTFETSLPFIKNPNVITYNYLDDGTLLVVCDSLIINIDQNGEIVMRASIPKYAGKAAISNEKIFTTNSESNQFFVNIYDQNGNLLNSSSNLEQNGLRSIDILSDSILVAWYFINSK